MRREQGVTDRKMVKEMATFTFPKAIAERESTTTKRHEKRDEQITSPVAAVLNPANPPWEPSGRLS